MEGNYPAMLINHGNLHYHEVTPCHIVINPSVFILDARKRVEGYLFVIYDNES